MSYFTPPPSGNWNGTMPFGHGANGQTHHHPQFSQQHQHPPQNMSNMPNPMLMMMTMYQQMQNVAPPAPRSQLPTPVAEAQKPFIPMDKHKLAQVLFQQTAKGTSYKAAIETMHGFDGYAAYAWKDFYLEHKQSVDLLVDEFRSRANRSTVQPVQPVQPTAQTNDVKRELSTSMSVDASASEEPPSRKRSKEGSNPPKSSKEKVKGRARTYTKEELSVSASRRKTLNSLSVTPADNLLALVPSGVAIDAHTGLPAAPSQCPTAPTAVASKGMKGRGNAYTEEDTVFFYQLLAWELANNPNATKGSICEVLYELAPHHSVLSWRTFWSRHEDVADKMLMLSELDDIDREERIRTWKKDGTVANTASGRSTKKVSYAESSSESEMEETILVKNPEPDSSDDESSDDAAEDDEDEDAIGSTDDDVVLGQKGEAFTSGEMRLLAKHIASVPGWFKGQKDWSEFVDKYTHRTAASWREYYRRKQKEVDEAAKKYMKRAKREAESNSIHQRRSRPSWASSGSGRPPSSGEGRQKRKFANDRAENGKKRARSDDTE